MKNSENTSHTALGTVPQQLRHIINSLIRHQSEMYIIKTDA